MKESRIRPAAPSDCEVIARIYNYYVRETIITFEEQEVTCAEMEARVADVMTGGLPWLVVEDAAGIAGYAYANKWKARAAYRHSVESTIYLEPTRTRMGLGRPLYEALLGALREMPIHMVIGGIALPNAASVALHERLGFVKVAHFKEVGFKFNQWIDVAYWQRAP
jgi:phosphinothricin acetyltransferase